MAEGHDLVSDDLMAKDWEVVDLSVVYVDRGQPQNVVHTLSRAEIQEKEREALRERANEQGMAGDPDMAEAFFEQAESHTVSPEAFKTRVMKAAYNLATEPLRARSTVTNQVRILPPWAVKEVSIMVRNVPVIDLALAK